MWSAAACRRFFRSSMHAQEMARSAACAEPPPTPPATRSVAPLGTKREQAPALHVALGKVPRGAYGAAGAARFYGVIPRPGVGPRNLSSRERIAHRHAEERSLVAKGAPSG